MKILEKTPAAILAALQDETTKVYLNSNGVRSPICGMLSSKNEIISVLTTIGSKQKIVADSDKFEQI
jgi:hypothetical protein